MNDVLYKVQTRFLFHAHIRIKFPAGFHDTVFDDLYGIMEDVNRKYNSYSEGSFIDRINRKAGSFVETDSETVLMLKKAAEISAFFNGNYDITILPLIRLWGFYDGEAGGKIPSETELQAVLPLIDSKKIEINGTSVKIGKGQEIITGSFIKAYAADKAVSRMRELRIDDAVINAGGSTICAVSPDAVSEWDIGIADPFDKNCIYAFSLGCGCLSTSSQSESYVTAEGRRFGHVLNPKTGFPASNRLVCVKSRTAMEGDMISTGLMNEPPETFLAAVSKLHEAYGIEAFLVSGEGDVIASPGFEYTHEKTAT